MFNPFRGQSSHRIVPLARVTICMIETFICIINNFLSGVQQGSVMFAFIFIVHALKGWVTWFVWWRPFRTHTHITNAAEERWESPGVFFSQRNIGVGGGTARNHCLWVWINPSVFSSCPHRASPLESGFIVWNASGFEKVFYLKQDYYLNMFYCIFIAPLVLLQFSTSKRRLQHLYVDYTNMSDICNLIGLQLKKCF